MIEPELFGPYRLIQPLARGGMAEIFLARKEGPAGFAKTVVVKRVLPHHLENRDFVQMFLDEARLAAQLDHPNVVHITDFGEVDGRYYLAMEYLRGYDLASLLRARVLSGLNWFPPNVAAAVVAQAATGLHFAHNAVGEDGQRLRIVHRDISPSNLFLTLQGSVKVLDFGVAMAEGKVVETRQGLVKGKLLYMSPEQTWGRALDARSDVWALGVVLHELVSGKRPFFRGRDDNPKVINERKVMEAIDKEAPPPLEVDADFSAIVARCLAKRPEDRFDTAQLLQRALEGYLAKKGPVSAETLAGFLRASIGTDEVDRLNLSTRNQASLAPPASPSAQTPIVEQILSGEILPASSSDVASPTQLARPSPKAEGAAVPAKPATPEVPEPAKPVAPPRMTQSVPAVPVRQRSLSTMVVGAALAIGVSVAVGFAVTSGVLGSPEVVSAPSPDASTTAVTSLAQPSPDASVMAASSVVQPSPSVDAGALADSPADAGALAIRPPEVTSVEVAEPTRRLPPKLAKGRLKLGCAPFGEVVVDGKPRGKAAPALELELPAGKHHVSCTHPALGESASMVEVPSEATVELQLQY